MTRSTKIIARATYVCLTLFLLSPVAVYAASDGNTPITSAQADEIISELRLIRGLLEQTRRDAGKPVLPTVRMANPRDPVEIDAGNAPFLGSPSAPLTIVEFNDYECPYCRRFFSEAFPQIKANYIDSGIVRFYILDLPLDIHPNALNAAQAGKCADEQGQFWAMHYQLEKGSAKLDLTSVLEYAGRLNLL